MTRMCDFSASLTCPSCGFVARRPNTFRYCVAPVPRLPRPPGSEYKPVGYGPGTELKKLLASMGITATESCPCSARAREMDNREQAEPGWCAANIDTIVGWLREEAGRRELPFIEAGARLLVHAAIKRAKKAAG